MTHIDWLSFTFQGVPTIGGGGGAPHEEAVNGLVAINPHLAQILGDLGDLVEGSGRAPFKLSLRSSRGGVALFYGHRQGLCLVELSGQGCQWLRDNGQEMHTLDTHFDRVTRLDIAHDWRTDIAPMQFASLRDEGRFKSVGDFSSSSGQTVYIGSRTSERYARVYRYHAPHPRADLLRLEMVFRKDAAKAIVQYIQANGLHAAFIAAGEGFKWSHPLWADLVNQTVDPVIWRPRERGGSTVRWLYNQVTPAVRKVLEGGDQEAVRAWLTDLVSMYYDYDASSEIAPDQYPTSGKES